METRGQRWRRRGRGCLALFIIFILGPVACLATCRARDAHPSDEALIAAFEANRETYERLRGMLLSEPHLRRVSYGFVRFADGEPADEAARRLHVSDRRLSDYRREMRALNLESGMNAPGDGSVRFYVSSQGFVTSGSSKELWWAPRLATNIAVAQRSTEEACRRAVCDVVRPIAPGWYIYLSRD